MNTWTPNESLKTSDLLIMWALENAVTGLVFCAVLVGAIVYLMRGWVNS